MARTHRINIQTTANARKLRGNMTDAECALWRAIRNKQLHGARFRRQYPIGSYIADFACTEKKCVIEVDGGQHQDQTVEDDERTAFMHKRGWQVLRFWNNDVLTNLQGVLSVVAKTLGASCK